MKKASAAMRSAPTGTAIPTPIFPPRLKLLLSALLVDSGVVLGALVVEPVCCVSPPELVVVVDEDEVVVVVLELSIEVCQPDQLQWSNTEMAEE